MTKRHVDMVKRTRATLALLEGEISFSVHLYAYDPDEGKIGLQAAQQLSADPACVLKTLMAEVDGRPVCVIVPSDRCISMRKLAAVFDGKSAAMMKPAMAEKLTGYRVGGISPFGQKRAVAVLMEQEALAHDFVYINGGQRGLQLRLAPDEVRRFLSAIIARVVS